MLFNSYFCHDCKLETLYGLTLWKIAKAHKHARYFHTDKKTIYMETSLIKEIKLIISKIGHAILTHIYDNVGKIVLIAFPP